MTTAKRFLLLLPALFLLIACDRVDPPSALVESAEEDGLPEPAIRAVAPATIPAGIDTATVAEGRRLFTVCTTCHGLDGGGTGLGPSLRDGEWLHISGTVEEIAAITRDGIASPAEFPIPMPVMGGGDFTTEELSAIATYVYALSRE